jgi:hypothetical protein
MGIISIIYLIIVGIACVFGGYIGVKSIIDTRKKNLKEFYGNRKIKRKELEK